VLIVDAGLEISFRDRGDGLTVPQQAVVGHMACVVSRALTELISQPGAWRIAALVSTARLLTPWIGLNAAALASASSARRFQQEFLTAGSSADSWIGQTASAAVTDGDAATMAELSAGIAMRLSGSTPREWHSCADDPPELQGKFVALYPR
jgi:hypothetical protein